MPPRIPSVPRLPRPPSAPPIGLFFCPSCSIWRASRPLSTPSRIRRARPQTLRTLTRLRYSSSLASDTAINAPLEVPVQFKELHDGLEGLGRSAANYVNLSRLQLALRGLEGREAVVRVAVLGMNGQSGARKLARLLLADPLGVEGGWEQKVETGEFEGRGLLLRYGNDGDAHPRNPLLETISVPSQTLQKHSLEILVTSLNIDIKGPGRSDSGDSPSDAILIPSLQIPTSASGRHTTVTYPVHKAIVVGEGLESIVAYGRFTAKPHSQSIPPEMVKVALRVPAPEEMADSKPSAVVTAVDLDIAAKGIIKFRESVANAVAYEHLWYRSGLPSITEWLATGIAQTDSDLKPAVKNLIISTLDDIETQLLAEDISRLKQLESSTILPQTRASILASLKIWAERGHTELRDSLTGAFAGRNWRKIAWWKLFWRVDDVSMIASEVLERRWLVDAEKGSIYMTGRIEEAGLLVGKRRPGEEVLTTSPESPIPESGITAPVSPFKWQRAEKRRKALELDGSVEIPDPRPWPMQIPVMRALLLEQSVPPLQALAQTLILQTLSTVSLTSALSALIFLSVPSLSVVEAGAVAVFGFVWSLRRMQVSWEGARDVWKGEITEEGRKALKWTEDLVKEIVETGGMPLEDVEGAEQRRAVREDVRRLRELLKDL